MFKTINGGKLPTRASKYSAGVDIYANEDVIIGAGETAIVPLGIEIDLENSNIYKTKDYIWAKRKKPSVKTLKIIKQQAIRDFKKSHYISLKPRSSLRAKGLISHTGVVDLDFKKEIKMIIHNPISLAFPEKNIDGSLEVLSNCEELGFLSKNCKIKKGDRIGQLLLMEHKTSLFGIESEEDRVGGFGSSGER